VAADPYAWSLSDETLVVVAALAGGYAVARRLEPRARGRRAAFAAGLVLVAVVFTTPLESLSLHYLLTAHLLQNVVLAEWAPALVVLGLPKAVASWVARARAVRVLTQPLVALPIWLSTYFAWHLPWLYDAALRRPDSLLHLEHLCYFLAGALLWWPVLQAEPHRLRSGAKAAYVFAAFVLASPLGLLLALLPNPVYSFYKAAPGLWGLSHLADQQIAGVTMTAEQAVVFFAVFVTYLGRHLREEESGEAFRTLGPT